MLDNEQLLARLEEVGVRNVDIEKVLGLPSSRVSEIRTGKRRVQLDEAAKLVKAFGLEIPAGQISPLSLSVARLIVRHVAFELGASPSDHDVEELAADLRAFGRFVSDPQVRDSVQAAEAFFQGIQIRRASA